MNAAARAIHQVNVFEGHLGQLHFSRQFVIFIFLLSCVLVTALGVIYSTNAYRGAYHRMENLERQAHRLQMEKGQLLLEKASLSTPFRIQSIAHGKLNMISPTLKNTIFVHKQ